MIIDIKNKLETTSKMDLNIIKMTKRQSSCTLDFYAKTFYQITSNSINSNNGVCKQVAHIKKINSEHNLVFLFHDQALRTTVVRIPYINFG